MPEKEFIEKYIPEEGEIIEYNSIEYIVRDAGISGSQLLKGESQLAIYEDGEGVATERLNALDSIPVYNLDPVGEATVVLGGIDPIFNIPLTALLENGFTKTGRRVDTVTKSDDLLFQTEDMSASKISKETLDKIMKVAKDMGVSVIELSTYLKGNPNVDARGVNGVADLVKGVIAIAQGRESVATTEELVHVATAILEQTNPALITSLISRIGEYKIYKQTLETYSKRKEYQLPNGKPDIRKIKKEAVDKLIAEYIILNSEGSTEFPELRDREKRNVVQRMWDTILEAIRSLYGKSKTDLFQETATKILEGDVGGTVADITQGGVFLQIEKNELVDNVYNTIQMEASKIVGPIPATYDASGKLIKKRHYIYDGKEVDFSVTEKLKQDSKMPERSEMNKLEDDQKRLWGSEGHAYIDDFITANLIDKDGYRTKEIGKTAIATKLNDTIKEKLEIFAKSLIASYPEGTRFLLEKKVVNTQVKGMLASTVDFIAIQPVVKKNGEKDIKVDVLDWKFASINKDLTEDVPWFKRDEWRAQMGEYVKMMYNYGIKASQLGKTRMVQFISNYTYSIYGDRKSPLNLTSIEVGNLDNAKETTLYLLPVPLITETTGNVVIDEFVKSLERQYDKLYIKSASPEEKFAKKIQLEELSKAIRHLHLKLDFEPLVGVGTTFLNNAAKAFKVFDTIDYSTLTAEELRFKLRELYEYKKSALKFSQLDDIFLSKFPTKNLSEADKKTLKSLEHIASSTGRMLDKAKSIENQFAVQISLKEGFTTEEGEKEGNEELGQSILTAERALDTASRTFLEGSKLSSKIINLATNLIMNAASLVGIKVNQRIKDYADLLVPLEKEARAIGKSAFDMIGKVAGGKLELIKKIDGKFLEAVEEAKESGDKKFLLDNMNLSQYMKLAEEAIKKGEEQINNTTFSTDEEENTLTRQYRVNKLKDELDITRATFNGYKAYQFSALFGKTMKEEDHLSSDYKHMSRSAASLEMWKFMTALNEKAISMGYLADRGISFFPLIEASLVEKVSNSGDILKESRDFFGDMFTTKIDEENKFSKLDPETNQIRKKIPTYFTRTNKEVTQISKDMTKIGPLWIKALMQYEAARDLEFTLLTLNSVEKNKGTVIVDENRNIVMEGGVPKVDKSINKNANLLETIIDDFLYQLGENLDSFGNIKIGQISDKLKRDDESKENLKLSIKKGVESSNKLVQSLAVGLSPLISIANTFGFNFQTLITAGNKLRYREFFKNLGSVVSGAGMTTTDIGLLDLIVPLNEDIAKEKQRELAYKQGYIKWLSTWTFTDVMMSTNSFPEKRLQLATAKTLNENSMVVDGKIVNIRQYVKAQDRGRYKTKNQAERKAIEDSYEERVAKLKAEKALDKIAKIENDRVVIPGVSMEELAKYRTSVVEYVRTLNGQMSADNKADYRRDTMFRSFMMFKNWIPKLVSQRTSDIKKNKELDQWEYGRGRLFLKTWSHLGLTSIFKMRQIIQGTDEGLAILDEMLKQKKEDYYRKTGMVLEITSEEFYDLVRTELNNEMKELGVLFGTLALMIAAKMAIPPEEEEDPLIRNRYKYILKGVNKITDEIGFYYNPLSTEAMTRGSIIPALGLLTKGEKIIEHVLREGYGRVTNNEDIIEKAHPTKYFLNVIPGAYQYQRDILSLVNPELAKEMGIRVTVESRRQ
jgi:hypothetical protein